MNSAIPSCSKANGRTSAKLTITVLVLALASARSIGEELCGRIDGSTTRDQATGSVLMAGATVVGVSSGRDGTAFRTDPAACGTKSQSDSPLPDCDQDGAVTLADYRCLYDCLNGPGMAPSEGCVLFDANRDGAVDLDDLGSFQNRFGTRIGQ